MSSYNSSSHYEELLRKRFGDWFIAELEKICREFNLARCEGLIETVGAFVEKMGVYNLLLAWKYAYKITAGYFKKVREETK